MNNEKLYNTIKARFRNYPNIKIEKARFNYGYYFDGIKDNYTEIPGVWIKYKKSDYDNITKEEYKYNEEKIYSVLWKLKNIRFENYSVKEDIYYKVIKLYGRNNKYRIFHLYNTIENGRLKQHKKQVEQYEDLTSCFYWFIQNNIGNY